MHRYLNTLNICPLFNEKNKAEIESIILSTNYKIVNFKKNDFIYKLNESYDYLGIVLSGSVELQNNLSSGRFFNVLYKRKGDVFGGALVFSKFPLLQSQYHIIAKENCTILLIHKESIYSVLFKDNIIASNILSLFSRNVLMLNKKIELFSYSSIQKKIACALLYNVNMQNTNVIHLPYSKKALAEHLNVSRSSLCRELKKLCDNNIIKMEKKTIEILNKDRLNCILNDL